jgi:predicted GNAT family acetyltransferase
MLNMKSASRLQVSMLAAHTIADSTYSFSFGTLGNQPAALAAFLRVAADLIEEGVEIDITRAMEGTTFYFTDWDERVCSMLVVQQEKEGGALVVEFGWTHPGMRRLGLFNDLMNQIIQCLYESASITSLRVSPPVSDDAFNAAVAKLGFKPVSLVAEYRPCGN